MPQRLQEEIIKQSDDHSIFTWNIRRIDQPGLLADSPIAFANCRNVRTTSSREGRASYTMTNRGLSLKLMVVSWDPDTYAARLDCTYEPKSKKCLGIFLRRLDEDDQYARVAVNHRNIVIRPRSVWDESVSEMPGPVKDRGLFEINVRQKITASNTDAFKERVNGFRIPMEFLTRRYETLRRLRLNNQLHIIVKKWREVDGRIYPSMSLYMRLTNALNIRCRSSWVRAMVLGFDYEDKPICFLSKDPRRLIDNKHLDKLRYSNENHSSKSCTFRWGEITGGTAEAIPELDVLRIEGDRVEGLRVYVEHHGILQIARKEIECGRLVWDVSRPFLQECSGSEGSRSLTQVAIGRKWYGEKYEGVGKVLGAQGRDAT